MQQTNLFKGKAASMVMSAPDQSIFRYPMSFGARDTLSAILEWAQSQTGLFSFSPRNLMDAFCKEYDQIKFEDIEQKYNTEQYIKALTGAGSKKAIIKPKTQADVISAMTMAKMYDRQWVHDNGMQTKNHIGSIAQASELYYWLISNFVNGDFSSTDIGKIVEMDRIARLDVIKREASQIVDTDKHSIAYLYAVIRGVASKDEILKHREAAVDADNLKKLAALGSLAIQSQTKTVHEFESPEERLERWNREREFAELVRNLDD